MKRAILYVVILLMILAFGCFLYFKRHDAFAQQQTQAFLFGTGVPVPSTADIDHVLKPDDFFSTSNWTSPVDWTSASIIFRADVAQMSSSKTMQLMVCMTRGPERAPTEEICDSTNMIVMNVTSPPWYIQMKPLKNWNTVTGNWTWDKPIDGVYVHVRDAAGNFLISQNCWPQRCYAGTENLSSYLPIEVFVDAIMFVPGTSVQAPWYWRSCPTNLCVGFQIDPNAPSGVSPPFPSATQVPPSATPRPSATNVPSTCGTKSIGDADCSGAASITDYAVWRIEYKGGCSGTNISEAACGDNKDNLGSAMDADFNGDLKVTLADYQIWRNNIQ